MGLSSFSRIASLGVVVCLSGCQENSPSARNQSPQKAIAPVAQKKASSRWAQRLYEQAKYDDAIQEASKVLLADPGNSHALMTIGRSHFEKGNHTAALQALRTIPREDLLYGASAQDLMIEWYLKAGPWDDAEEMILAQMKLRPDDRKTRIQYVWLMNLCGRRYEANRACEQILEKDSLNHKLLMLLLDPNEALDTRTVAQSILKEHPDDCLANLALANYAMYLQDDKAAIEGFEKALARRPVASACANLALAYARTENWRELTNALVDAPQDTATFPAAWLALGAMYETQGQIESAKTCYLMAVDTYVAEPSALRGLVRTLVQTDQTKAADAMANQLAHCVTISEQLKTLSRNPSDLKAILQLSKALQFFGRQREALAWLATAWEHTGPTEGLKSDIQKLKSQIAATTATQPPGVSATKHWAKVLNELSQRSSLEPSTPERIVSNTTDTTITFRDIADEIGVLFKYDMGPVSHDSINVYQTNGSGVGAFDFNLDGWTDMYFTQAGGIPLQHSPDRVNAFFRNVDGKAVECHAQACLSQDDWGQGVANGDFDSDGFPDIFVACFGKSILWLNQGDATFVRCLLPTTVTEPQGMTTSAAMADVNGDGLPDLIEVNYSDLRTVMTKECIGSSGVIKSCSPTEFVSADDRIWLNNGDGTLRGANEQWNLPVSDGRGLGVVVGNFDRRDGNDVFIANDMNANHYLASTKQSDSQVDGYKLVDESTLSGLSVDNQGRSQGSMGIASGDFNRDGTIDLFITNFYDEFNVVYAGMRGGIFADQTSKFRMAVPNKETLGFGTQAVDFDRDGYLDLAILNGHVDDFSHEGTPFQMKPELYRGSKRGFDIIPNEKVGAYFTEPTLGRALITLDWDRDLRLDMVAVHLDCPVALIRNETKTPNHAVQFELVGTKCDRDATGAYIEVFAGSDHWTTSLVRGSGFLGSNEPVIDVGIGHYQTVDRVVVTWPNYETQEFKDLKADSRYLIVQDQSTAWPR